MANMFAGCIAFNNNSAGSLWNDGTALRSLTDVTTMSGMFNGCTIFNANIGAWDTSNVTDMSSMFFNAPAFNRDISTWNTTNVLTFSNMFNSDTPPPPSFNAPIKYWVVRSGALFTDMFASNGAFNAAYYGTSQWYGPSSGTANTQTTPDYRYFGAIRPPDNPCFMKGSLILCLRGEEEVYRPVQDLRKGDLVKTYRNGYLPIHMIGTSSLSNPGDEVRISNRLYKCSKELYPDLFEDLYITGCHSILVPALTNDQWENTKAMLGNVYITDNHFRLMACVDEKAQPYKRDAMIDIYHIALENDDYYMNYGIYANGLLVETCSRRYLKEISGMTLL
jgi:surface protein